MMTKVSRRQLGLIAAAAMTTRTASAQAPYPSRPVRMILPVSVGGLTDAVGRVLAEEMAQALGQPVVPENIGGAGSTLGALALLRSPPDGYAIMTATNNHPVMRQLYPNFTQDPVDAFGHLALMARQPFMLAVHPDAPARDVPGLLAWLRTRRDTINYGAGTPGSTNHMAGELLKQVTGLNFTIVPYRSSAMAVQDLVAGRLDMTIETPTMIWPMAEAGKLRVLGLSALTRSALYPDVPTLAESGLPDFDVSAWQTLVARPDLPDGIRQTLVAAARQVATSPRMRERLLRIGVETWPDPSPEAAVAHLRAEVTRWVPVAARMAPPA